MKVRFTKFIFRIKFNLSGFIDFIRPKDYLESNAPKPINLCIDDFNAVKRKEFVFNENVNISI